MKGLNIENSNSINLLEDFLEDNGALIEHFDIVDYEVFDEVVYENYLLEKMGDNFTVAINGSNMSLSL